MSHHANVRVAVIQLRAGHDPQQNLQETIARIHAAADQGAQIICTQELFLTPYFCQTEDHVHFELAEPIPGPTTEALAPIARERDIVLVASLFERRAAGLYHNTAVVLDADGSLVGKYRKMHIPDDPLFYEKFYFTPGDLGFLAFDRRYARVGVCICSDQWYPEAPRLTAMQGAELWFYPTAIGWIPGEKDTYGPAQYSAWQTMMRSHSIANGLFVGAPNRVGREGEIEFWGGSFVSDPYGNVMAQAIHDGEQNLVVSCDLSLINTARTHWPFFRDRRVDAFGDLQRRWCQH
ncbi:MAG: carbon-nitrogen hydrolase [Planctomycetaceae bacterium]|nr:carbon-nitrogen hydrolase [Planctomycetaceae bacterium]